MKIFMTAIMLLWHSYLGPAHLISSSPDGIDLIHDLTTVLAHPEKVNIRLTIWDKTSYLAFILFSWSICSDISEIESV